VVWRSLWDVGNYVQRIAERGRRKPEIAGLARTAAAGGGSSEDARASLRQAIAADAGLGEGARKLCLAYAVEDPASAAVWTDAAGEIETALKQGGAP
jgi:hypothetical protein